MTELDHEVVKGLCDRMNTIYEIYKKRKKDIVTSEASYLINYVSCKLNLNFRAKNNCNSGK